MAFTNCLVRYSLILSCRILSCRCISWGWEPNSQLFSTLWTLVYFCNCLCKEALMRGESHLVCEDKGKYCECSEESHWFGKVRVEYPPLRCTTSIALGVWVSLQYQKIFPSWGGHRLLSQCTWHYITFRDILSCWWLWLLYFHSPNRVLFPYTIYLTVLEYECGHSIQSRQITAFLVRFPLAWLDTLMKATTGRQVYFGS